MRVAALSSFRLKWLYEPIVIVRTNVIRRLFGQSWSFLLCCAHILIGVVWCGLVWSGVVWCGLVWSLYEACKLARLKIGILLPLTRFKLYE